MKVDEVSRGLWFCIELPPGKGNMMADILSKKNTIVMVSLWESQFVNVINSFGLELWKHSDKLYLGHVLVQPTLIQRVFMRK